MQDIKYKIYPTLLDGFQRYLDSEEDTALQELIDKINRKPFASVAADKGTAFNEVVDGLIAGTIVLPNGTDFLYRYKGQDFEFNTAITMEFANDYKGAISQLFTEAVLPTRYGNVLIYGYLDEVKQDLIVDIKTTSKYEFPKFLYNWQHIVYPYCLNYNGIHINNFRYDITDFKYRYYEDYTFNPARDTERLREYVERFIEFLETIRPRVENKKIFGIEEVGTQTPVPTAG